MSELFPSVVALFQKRIEGDDALLRLAQSLFKRAGLGAEFYAETPDELGWLIGFKPLANASATVHLDRGLDLLAEQGRRKVLDFAGRFRGDVFGLVVHDQVEAVTRPGEYAVALGAIDAALSRMTGAPMLFVEYAVGLDPERFVEVFERIGHLEHVSACVDTGHVGLWQARKVFARRHGGQDVCALALNDPQLPEKVADVQDAVRSGLEVLLKMIPLLGALAKPIHVHLHDGHPLSKVSPFGISDHLSFNCAVPIPFEYQGRRELAPLFGPQGLLRIVRALVGALPPNDLSCALEIHPAGERRPLGEYARLFEHWQDKTNAERMNGWIYTLLENRQLVFEAFDKCLAR